jgi:hypothetical protein
LTDLAAHFRTRPVFADMGHLLETFLAELRQGGSD